MSIYNYFSFIGTHKTEFYKKGPYMKYLALWKVMV